jgi:hypothetical protein
MSRGGAWNDKHKLALLTGVLLFWVLLSPLQEISPDRPDDTTGMTVVAFLAVLLLIWLRWKTRRRVRAETAEPRLEYVTPLQSPAQ